MYINVNLCEDFESNQSMGMMHDYDTKLYEIDKLKFKLTAIRSCSYEGGFLRRSRQEGMFVNKILEIQMNWKKKCHT